MFVDDIYEFIQKNNVMIKKIYEDSKRVRKELGFPICKENSTITMGQVYFGKQRSIRVEGCDVNGSTIGELHTHPYGSSDVSSDDLYVLFANNYEVMCIVGEDRVSCYQRNRNEVSDGLREAVRDNYEHINQLNNEINAYNQKIYEEGVKGINLRVKAKLERRRIELLRKKMVLSATLFILKNHIVTCCYQCCWEPNKIII